MKSALRERDQTKQMNQMNQSVQPTAGPITPLVLSTCDPTIISPPATGAVAISLDGFHATGSISSPDNFASMTVGIVVHETPPRYVLGRPYTSPGNGPNWDFLFPSTDTPPLPTNRALTLIVTVNGRDGSSVTRVRDFQLTGGGVGSAPSVTSAQMVSPTRIFVQYSAEMDLTTVNSSQNYALSGLPGVMLVPPLQVLAGTGQPTGVSINLSSAPTHAFILVINPSTSPSGSYVRSATMPQVVLEDSPDHEEDITV